MEVTTLTTHPNEEVTPSSAADEEEDFEPVTPISFSQIIKYYNSEPVVEAELMDSVREYKCNTIKKTIERINRHLKVIKKNWPDAKPIQIYIAFQKAFSDVEELVFLINDPEFLESVNDDVAYLESQMTTHVKRHHMPERELVKKASDDEMDGIEDSEEAEFTESEEEDPESSPTVKSKPRNKKFSKTMRPDPDRDMPPCPKGINPSVWRTWSSAHQQSYLKGLKKPNSFLYRNLPPGEKQKNGSWTPEERTRFLNRYNEMKQDMKIHGTQWGIFSLAIPGRVGYQCANFYRKMVAEGVIKDSQYVFDADGNLRMKSRLEKKEGRAPKTQKNKEIFYCNPNRPSLSKYERRAQKNPLPGVIDSITKEEIKVPTISPDGYILDYNTWMNILKTSQNDPFTQNHINKRKLVVLTEKNIAEYIEKIKNL